MEQIKPTQNDALLLHQYLMEQKPTTATKRLELESFFTYTLPEREQDIISKCIPQVPSLLFEDKNDEELINRLTKLVLDYSLALGEIELALIEAKRRKILKLTPRKKKSKITTGTKNN